MSPARANRRLLRCACRVTLRTVDGMALDPQAREELTAATALVEHALARVRLGGLLRLVRLADEHPSLRQPVVHVLGAYLRSPAATGSQRQVRADRDARRELLRTLREHLTDPDAPTTWCGLDVDLSRCELAGDLSGIVVTAGTVRLDGVRVPAGRTLDVRDVRVTGGALSMTRLEVAGRLDATGLAVDGGEACVDGLVVTGHGRVTLDGARLADGCLWLRDGSIGTGTLSLRGVHVTGGHLSLHETRVSGGEVRLDDLAVDGGNVHVSAATVESGALRMDDLRVAAGLVSLTMTHVEDGRMSLDGARVEGGAVRFEGLAVDRRADVSWGPFDPVEPLPGPERTGRRDLDLRGPAPVDRWAWLRHEPADHDVTTPARPPRQDVPSRTGRAAS